MSLVGNQVGIYVARKRVVRRNVQGKVIYIPLDPWSRGVKGVGVGNVEASIPRSGVDSVGRRATGSTSPGSSMESTSLLALLRFRRCFFGTGRKSLHFILLGRWCRSAKIGEDGGMITDSGPRGCDSILGERYPRRGKYLPRTLS